MRICGLILLLSLVSAAASRGRPARYYSYSGNDPAHWTSSDLHAGAPSAPADFTVSPCGSTDCTAARVATDRDGNTYVAGSRRFPGGPSQLSDVYVAKLDPAGAIVFLATFSGKGSDEGRALAVDPAGNILVGGTTSSPNFPLRNPVQAQASTRGTGFLIKLNPEGQLVYSTYFGGTADMSSVNAVATDAAGSAYVTGITGSRDFTTTPGMPAGRITGASLAGIFGAFVAKLSPAGDKVLYAGTISGSAEQCGCCSSCFLSIRTITGQAIAVDAAGNAYVAGNSNVTDLPTTPGALVPTGIGAWVARINASGTKLDYLTYLGAANYVVSPLAHPANTASDLAVDASGNAFVVGSTSDPRFPATAGALAPRFHGPSGDLEPPGPPADGFVAKLNPQGTAMVWATFLGGADVDAATAIALEPGGSAYVTGTTRSSDFPVAGFPSSGDFIAVLNPTGTVLTAGARYPGGTVSQAIAVDAGGRVRAASPGGLVSSLVLNPPPAPRFFGIANAAGGPPGAVVAPGEVVSLYGAELGPAAGVSAQADGGKLPTALAGTQVLFDGVAAPLLYVSRNQINAVAPFGLTAGKPAAIRVKTAASTSADFSATVVSAHPGVFKNGGGFAAAINQDGSQNSESKPARPGSIVSIWATGAGQVFPAPTDGEIATAAQNYYCCSISSGGELLQTEYAGAAPGTAAGVVQINFRVPDVPAAEGLAAPVSFDLAVPANPLARTTAAIWVAR